MFFQLSIIFRPNLKLIAIVLQFCIMTHGSQMINCEICNVKIRQSSLKEHIFNIHEKKEFECGICFYKTTQKRSLKIHLLSQHLNGIANTFKCPVCEKEFNLKESLSNHIRASHGEKCDKVFQCNICDFVTSSSSGLKTHKAAIHVRASTIKCTFENCNLTFTANKCLNTHKNAAHIRLRFKCQLCSYEATQKVHLQTHIKRIHLNEYDKIHCKICDKMLQTGNGMKSHVNRVHKSLKRKCKYCDYTMANWVH